MEINLQIFVEGEKHTLRMKDVSEETGIEVIRDFFQVGKNTEDGNEDENVFVESPIEAEASFEEVKRVPLGFVKEAEVEKDKPADPSESENVKDKSEPADQPDFWTTGIKVDEDGTKRYKLRYWCECGEQGNHYIPLDVKDVSCHKCNYLIDVEAAGKIGSDGVPARDGFGNFFVARAGITWSRRRGGK